MVWNLEALDSYKIDYIGLGWILPLRQSAVATPAVVGCTFGFLDRTRLPKRPTDLLRTTTDEPSDDHKYGSFDADAATV